LKKPSATKPSLAQLDLTFFTDRDLGKAVPRLLRESGLVVDREAIRTIMMHTGRLFILRGKVPSKDLATMFLQAESTIVDLLTGHDQAFISNVSRTLHKGGIVKAAAKMMLTWAEWKGEWCRGGWGVALAPSHPDARDE